MKKPAARAQSKDRDTGAALRSVYQKTVDEAVPSDLMDLLGKLS
ncbi:NepR family anti-sigma factor [Sphingomonas bacterium]|nr:NepR family anti-sigma factor [Sphingomonas bacterium]